MTPQRCRERLLGEPARTAFFCFVYRHTGGKMIRRSPVLMALLIGAAAPVQAQDPASDVPLYDDLGAYHHAITTREPRAQQYFDQGLRLYYAFNHAEAIRAFRAAAQLDDQCAMCWWGEALSYGPNINLPMDSASGVAAYAAIREAQARNAYASPRERALIDALATRYEAVPPAARARLDTAYAAAMANVAREYPEDPEAVTLRVEAIMDLSPWNFWEPDGSPRPQTRSGCRRSGPRGWRNCRRSRRSTSWKTGGRKGTCCCRSPPTTR